MQPYHHGNGGVNFVGELIFCPGAHGTDKTHPALNLSIDRHVSPLTCPKVCTIHGNKQYRRSLVISSCSLLLKMGTLRQTDLLAFIQRTPERKIIPPVFPAVGSKSRLAASTGGHVFTAGAVSPSRVFFKR